DHFAGGGDAHHGRKLAELGEQRTTACVELEGKRLCRTRRERRGGGGADRSLLGLATCFLLLLARGDRRDLAALQVLGNRCDDSRRLTLKAPRRTGERDAQTATPADG